MEPDTEQGLWASQPSEDQSPLAPLPKEPQGLKGHQILRDRKVVTTKVHPQEPRKHSLKTKAAHSSVGLLCFIGSPLTTICVCGVDGKEVYDAGGEVQGDVVAVLEDG